MKSRNKQKANFKCVIHGSFRKHFDEIKRVHRLFTNNGIEVLSPTISEIQSIENGFVILDADKEKDPRLIELLYLHNLKRLGENGFSYFVNLNGYIGKSASYELGIAQVSDVKCFFKEKLDDHPAYFHGNAIWQPEDLIEYIKRHNELPEPKIKRNEKTIYKLWKDLMVPGSIVAVGGIIEYIPTKPKRDNEVLLVKTHKWQGQYSIVGGRVRKNEKLGEALLREVRDQTGLRVGISDHICTFNQIENSGYYLPHIRHIFVDKIVRTNNKKIKLNEEAEEYIWIPPQIALKELPIEPNAKHTLELYSQMLKV